MVKTAPSEEAIQSLYGGRHPRDSCVSLPSRQAQEIQLSGGQDDMAFISSNKREPEVETI